MILAIPIMHGLARYSDLYSLTLLDFMRMNEILLVKNENESRAYKSGANSADNTR
jgi:hypothetical protein